MLALMSPVKLGLTVINCATVQKCDEAKIGMGTGSFCKRGPTSPFIFFPHLFLLLSPLLAPEKLQYLKNCHREFQVAMDIRATSTCTFALIFLISFLDNSNA